MQIQEKVREGQGWRIEHRAAALERFLERHQILILSLWSLAYFCGISLRAQAKPFWYDEILTLLEARQPSLSACLRALGDVDWMPPASHLVFYLTNKLAGSGEIGFRIPSMIGFWAFCLCLFFFARRRVSFFFAFVALLLPFFSSFYEFSFEARSYGLMLGFCGVALVSWQAATESSRRAWPLAGLVLSLGAAIALQYWAVLIYIPLAGAEAYRDFRRRRADWPVWIAFAAGGVPLLFFFFLLVHGFHSWLPWHEASRQDFFLYYRRAVRRQNRPYIVVGTVLAVLAWLVSRAIKSKPNRSSPAMAPAREWLAAVLLILTPVWAISLALIVPPHMFTERYALPVLAGFALMASFLAAWLAKGRASIGILFALGVLIPFVHRMTPTGHFENPFGETPGLRRVLEKGPVVVDTGIVPYLQLWWYTPDSLKSRLLFLWLDPDGEVALRGPFVKEFPKVGVPVLAYKSLATPENQFWIYAEIGGGVRIKVLADGGSLTDAKLVGEHVLLHAHVK